MLSLSKHLCRFLVCQAESDGAECSTGCTEPSRTRRRTPYSPANAISGDRPIEQTPRAVRPRQCSLCRNLFFKTPGSGILRIKLFQCRLLADVWGLRARPCRPWPGLFIASLASHARLYCRAPKQPVPKRHQDVWHCLSSRSGNHRKSEHWRTFQTRLVCLPVGDTVETFGRSTCRVGDTITQRTVDAPRTF